MSCGIYKIINNLNGKCYVGQSIHIEERWQEHISLSKDGTYCYEKPLYRAFRKYGIENFTFEILEECPKEELGEKEKYYIILNNAYLEGYNCNLGGNINSDYNTTYKQKIKNIIEDLQNDELTEKEIAKKYNVSYSVVWKINRGKTYTQFNLTYPIRNNNNSYKEQNKCVDCGKEIDQRSTRCVKCANKARRTEKPMSREELKMMIRILSFTEIGKKYHCADNNIRK